MRFPWFERTEVDYMTFSESILEENYCKYTDSFSLCTNELLCNGVKVHMFLRVDSRRRGIKNSRDPGFDAFCVIEG